VTNFKPGQTVYAKCGTEGKTQLITAATFIRPSGKMKLLLRHPNGSRFEAKNEDVYPTKELLEASIPELRISVNEETGRVTHFPANPALSREGKTLWDHRKAGTPSSLGGKKAEWVKLPPEVLAFSPGPVKRRILHEGTAPSKLTGREARALVLEGDIICLENPDTGWEFYKSS
jgi:hypothetical protein